MRNARRVVRGAPWQKEIRVGDLTRTDASCIGIGAGLDPVQMLTLALDHGYRHICQKGGHSFDQELASAATIIAAPENYLHFPVATILSPSKINVVAERENILLDERFNSSSQKLDVMETLVKAMESKPISQTILEDVKSVADELFTNAIYNAPFVDINTHHNPGISRQRVEVKLDGGRFARIFMAIHQSRLIIGCEDPYGSLNLENYLKKIQMSYAVGPAATMNFGPGGAGIGSYIIFNAGASLYFGVWPNRATILSCVLPLGMSNRQRIQLPKHFHRIQS